MRPSIIYIIYNEKKMHRLETHIHTHTNKRDDQVWIYTVSWCRVALFHWNKTYLTPFTRKKKKKKKCSYFPRKQSCRKQNTSPETRLHHQGYHRCKHTICLILLIFIASEMKWIQTKSNQYYNSINNNIILNFTRLLNLMTLKTLDVHRTPPNT